MIETIKPILTEADHTATLAEIDRLIALNAHEGSPDDDRLIALGILAADWEEKHIEVPPCDPI